MNKLSFIILLLYAGVLSFKVPAQNKNADSLVKLLAVSKNDTGKIILLNKLYNLYRDNDKSKAEAYANEQMKLSVELAASSDAKVNRAAKKGEAAAFQCLGALYHLKGDYANALSNYHSCVKIRKELKDSAGLANIYNNLGRYWYEQGEFAASLDFYQNSLRTRTALKDSSGICAVYVNIAGLHSAQGNDSLALQCYENVIAIQRKLGFRNKAYVANAYNNMGIIYRNRKDYSKALDYYKMSMVLKKEINDVRGLAASFSNIGAVLFDQRNYDSSVIYLNQAKEIQEAQNDKSGLIISCTGLGNNYYRLDQIKKAESMYSEALRLANETGQKDLIAEAYEGLSAINEKTGNYKAAFQFHVLFAAIRDSLLNVENSKQLNEMNVKYETEKKDNELVKKDADLAIEKTEREKQSMLTRFFIGGFSVMLVLVFFILRANMQRRRAFAVIKLQKEEVERQRNEITLQKEETERQKQIVEEKQKEILDSIYYARRIQRALITNEKYIERKLTSLNRK